MDIADVVDGDGAEQTQGSHAFDKSISSAKTYEADATGRIGSYNPSVESKGSMFGQ